MLCVEKVEGKNEEVCSDILLELRTKEKELFGRLDPSIRHRLQKGGVSLKENIYVGFDTEFSRKDTDHNNLISAQLAVTTGSYVQIPRNTPYTLSNLDDKNKIIKLRKTSTVFNYQK